MHKIISAINQSRILILTLAVLLLAGCGLGLSTQDRLDRAQAAFQSGEYRAAIIDSKYVLQDHPDNVAARLLLGRASIEEGDAVTAEIELRRAVELGTDVSDVLVDLGRALYLRGKLAEVVAEIDPSISTNDTDRFMALRLRGDAQIALGIADGALQSYTDMLAIEPDNMDALLGVVQSYITIGNLLQARQTLDQVLEVDQTNVPAWIASGSLNTKTNNVERADFDFRKAVNLARASGDDNEETVALNGLADLLLSQRKSDEVRPISSRMADIAPQDSRSLLIAARLAIIDSEWSDAQRDLQEVLRRSPNYRFAQMLLGSVHKERGNLAQAEMYLSAVVAASPDNRSARQLLAQTRLEMNKSRGALDALAPLINDEVPDTASLSMAAMASIQSGELESAAVLLQRGINEEPGNFELHLQLAYARFAAGRMAEARQILSGLPNSMSEQSEMRRDVLVLLTNIASGDDASGLADAEAIVARWPSQAEAHTVLGFSRAIFGDRAGAEQSFSNAVRLDPTNSGPIWFLAQLDEGDEDFESAGHRYNSLLEIQPTDIRGMIGLARIAARLEQPDEALDWLEKARATDESALGPRQLLATIYLAMRDFEAAEDVVKEGLSISDRVAGLHNSLGLVELNRNNFRDAETSFRQAIEIDGAHSEYRLNLARTKSLRGDKIAAATILEASDQEVIHHLPSALSLAALKAELGQFSEAKDIVARLKTAYPDSAAPHALEGELMALQGNVRGASSAYDRALAEEALPRFAVRGYQLRTEAGLDNQLDPLIDYLQKRPLDSNLRIYLAQAYQQRNNTVEAIVQYERIFRDDSQNFVAANNLAWAYFQSGDSRAAEVARRAYELRPDNSSVMDTLGWILVKNGKYQEGIGLLRNAVKLSNGRAEVRYHLAAALAETGNAAEAMSILEDIVAKPDTFTSRQAAEELLAAL